MYTYSRIRIHYRQNISNFKPQMSSIVSEKTLPASAFSSYRFVMAGLILFANFSIGLLWSSLSPLLPLVMDDFSISASTASLLIAVPVFIKSLIGLPGSVIISRFGMKRIFSISWFMIGALALSFLASNYITLLVLRLSYGVGAGLMMPALGGLVMQWFPVAERTLINSLNLIIMSLGISISYAIAAPLTEIVSWQGVLSILGTVGLLGAVAWVYLGRVRAEEENVKVNFNFQEVWDVLRDKTIFLLFLGDSLVFTLYAALSNWLPTYYYEVRGMPLSQAGNITGLMPFIGMFAVIAGGFLAQRVKEKRLLFLIPGILVMLGGFGSFLIENVAGIYISVITLGIGAWVYQPILLTLPMDLPWMTPNKIAIVWGASMTVAGFGMFLSPIVVGASQDILGSFVPGFILCAVPASFLIFTGLLLPEHKVSIVKG